MNRGELRYKIVMHFGRISPTQATVLVIRKLFPKQKATFWTTIYLCVLHAERSHDFLAFVQGFRQTMPFGQRVTMFYQIGFKA